MRADLKPGRRTWLPVLVLLAGFAVSPSAAQDNVPATYEGEVRPLTGRVVLRYAPVTDVRMAVSLNGTQYTSSAWPWGATATVLWTVRNVTGRPARNTEFDLRLVALGDRASDSPPLAEYTVRGPANGPAYEGTFTFPHPDVPAGTVLAGQAGAILRRLVLPFPEPPVGSAIPFYKSGVLADVLHLTPGTVLSDDFLAGRRGQGGVSVAGLTTLRGREALLVRMGANVVTDPPKWGRTAAQREFRQIRRASAEGYQVIDLATGVLLESYVRVQEAESWGPAGSVSATYLRVRTTFD